VLDEPTSAALLSDGDNDGRSPLHLAALSNRDDLFGPLLSHPAVSVGLKDVEGNTPVHLAAGCGAAAFLAALRDNAAVVVKKRATLSLGNERGDTPLHVAVRAGHTACVSILLQMKVDVQVRARLDRNSSLFFV
jgi:ankyrin repeat protein